jgi:phospholipid/cholesterol/gamma-HCH transport system permease protein
MIIDQIGAWTLRWIESFGDYCNFVLATLGWTLRGPGRFAWQQLWVQMYEIGTLSIPVVAITGAFIGMVLAIEAYPQFQEIGMTGRLGSVISISVVKQIGPVLTGVMLAGRVGGALTAELGTMRVTEQIDALRAMASDPIRTLVVPRFAACVIMLPLLTIISDWVGVFGGWFMSVQTLGVDNGQFMHFATTGLDLFTINTGLIKSIFFGLAIGSIACYKGFRASNGAQGVGRACTDAFVLSFIAILAANFFLAVLLNALNPNAGSFLG